MNYSDLVKNYLKIINKELIDVIKTTNDLTENLLTKRDSVKPDELNILQLCGLLSRGIVVCNNDQVTNRKFLLTGINPSYTDGDNIYPFKYEEFKFNQATNPIDDKGNPKKKFKNSFWGKKREQFGALCDEIAYLDLFPLRETHQNDGFENVLKNRNYFLGRLLEVTQNYIQELSPKLIVHANRTSIHYWGTNNDWMGYKLHKIESRMAGMPDFISNEKLNRFPMYRIEGYSDHQGRINKGKENNNLIGTYLIQYVMEYRTQEDRETLYKKEQWKKIFEWVIKQE